MLCNQLYPPNSYCATAIEWYSLLYTKHQIYIMSGENAALIVYIFLSLYDYCSLMIIACYLLPSLLLLLLLPLLSRNCYVVMRAHLSQFHNKQTSESIKSTATTKMSDKRVMSWNTYFVCVFFFFASLSLSFLLNFIVFYSEVYAAATARIWHFIPFCIFFMTTSKTMWTPDNNK